MAPNFLSTENVDGIGESSARLCCFAYQSKNQLELARATEPQLGELFSLKMSAQPGLVGQKVEPGSRNFSKNV